MSILKIILTISLLLLHNGLFAQNNKSESKNSNNEKSSATKDEKKKSKDKSFMASPVQELSNISSFVARGEVSHNLVLPQVDKGELKSLTITDTMRGLPNDKLFFETMIIRLYNKGNPDMIIRMPTAVFDVKNNIISCEHKTYIEGSKEGFLIKGESFSYDVKNNFGGLLGNTIMVINTKEPSESSELKE